VPDIVWNLVTLVCMGVPHDVCVPSPFSAYDPPRHYSEEKACRHDAVAYNTTIPENTNGHALCVPTVKGR
jgi:hypothetical protein